MSPPEQPVAVCYAGLPGAGKTTAARIGRELFGGGSFSMGAALRTMFERDHGNSTDSHALGQYATDLRADHGPAVFAEWMVDDWMARGWDGETFEIPFHIDGVRCVEEIEAFRDYFGTVFIVFVKSWEHKRLRRLQERGRDGEDTFTRADLEERDLREIEWGAYRLQFHSHVRLYNNFSMESLRAQVARLFDSRLNLGYRPASEL